MFTLSARRRICRRKRDDLNTHIHTHTHTWTSANSAMADGHSRRRPSARITTLKCTTLGCTRWLFASAHLSSSRRVRPPSALNNEVLQRPKVAADTCGIRVAACSRFDGHAPSRALPARHDIRLLGQGAHRSTRRGRKASASSRRANPLSTSVSRLACSRSLPRGLSTPSTSPEFTNSATSCSTDRPSTTALLRRVVCLRGSPTKSSPSRIACPPGVNCQIGFGHRRLWFRGQVWSWVWPLVVWVAPYANEYCHGGSSRGGRAPRAHR